MCPTLSSHLHPEWRHLQAVHVCHLAGHLSVAVQAAPGGALHRRWLCQLHTLLSSGGLPLPGHAGSEAKVLLCLDTWWVRWDFVSDSCNFTFTCTSVLVSVSKELRLQTLLHPLEESNCSSLSTKWVNLKPDSFEWYELFWVQRIWLFLKQSSILRCSLKKVLTLI